MQAEPTVKPRSADSAALVLCGAAIVVVILARKWNGWAPELQLLVPAIAAWGVRRRSLLATVYLTQMSAYFGLAGLISGKDRPPTLTTAVLVWALGITIGTLARPEHTDQLSGQRRLPQIKARHIVVTAALVGVNLATVASQRAGFGAQLSTGLSNPAGVAGVLTAVAPLATLTMVLLALANDRLVAAALTIAALQVLVLSLSGFRGSALAFLISGAVATMLILPKESPWRRGKRVVAAASAIVLIGVVSFTVGLSTRSRMAAEQGLFATGSATTAGNVVDSLAVRLDLSSYLQRAVEMQDDPGVRETVSWRRQLTALVPNLPGLDKRPVDYGSRLAVTAYGLPDSRSSATITTVGDTIVNFGLVGAGFCALLLGLLMTWLERRIRFGSGPTNPILAASVAVFVVGQESPLILNFASTLRSFLVVFAIGVLCSGLRQAGTPTGSPRSTSKDSATGTRSLDAIKNRTLESA